VTPSKPNGIKLELFIFDIFPFLEKQFVVFSVPREDEFSPLKNAPGTAVDCPETSRRDVYQQCVRYIKDAGGDIVLVPGSKAAEKLKEGSPEYPIFEISPLVSYDGEALESVKGKSLKLEQPVYIASKADLNKFQ
jgi:UDP-N-acetylglucosamine/UDP-N-acetylgalactosamine diphosphorylase